MLTCKSPRQVMRVASSLASQSLPIDSSKFSRHDFTLPQLFACLVVKELLKRSYREAEALLAECPHWCRAIGMCKHPDPNTLCRASKALLHGQKCGKRLDPMGRWAALARLLGLRTKPLAIDSSC